MDRVENQVAVEQLFKTVWADHADLISIQYTGTGRADLLFIHRYSCIFLPVYFSVY